MIEGWVPVTVRLTPLLSKPVGETVDIGHELRQVVLMAPAAGEAAKYTSLQGRAQNTIVGVTVCFQWARQQSLA
jgi:hypothetical protein